VSTSAFDPPRAPAEAPGAPPKPKIVRRLQAQRAKHKSRGVPFRAATAVAGFLVVALGILALPFPGPGWLIIFIGLAVLSLEFAWAGRALDWLLVQVARFQRRVQRASGGERLAMVLVLVVIVGAILAWAYFGDIPLVPEPGDG
jgi:uncharacterized protein (TIGR02611 family)